MDLDINGRILKIKEKPLLSEIQSNFRNPVANATVYLFAKEFLNLVPSNCDFDFPADLFPLLINKGVSCFGFNIDDGYRYDIGTISNYFNYQLSILKGEIDFEICFPQIEDKLWIGKNSTISSTKNIKKPVLICNDCQIDANVTMKCSIIGNHSYVGRNSYIENSIILDNVHIGSNVKILNSIIGDNSILSDGIQLPSNTGSPKLVMMHCNGG